MYYNLNFISSGNLPPGRDRAFSLGTYDSYLFDASSGIYLYGRNFYFGYSASNLFQSSFKTAIEGSPYPNSEFRNHYGMGAYRFKIINKDWQLEPSFLLRKMKNRPIVTDFTTRIFYLENNWTGLTYRSDGSLIFCLGFATGGMHISYSYDHSFMGEIMQYTYGTHEIGISFRIQTLATQRHIGFWSY